MLLPTECSNRLVRSFHTYPINSYFSWSLAKEHEELLRAIWWPPLKTVVLNFSVFTFRTKNDVIKSAFFFDESCIEYFFVVTCKL